MRKQIWKQIKRIKQAEIRREEIFLREKTLWRKKAVW